MTDRQLAEAIGEALTVELGGSRRATKMIMRWTGVSDRTARSWLHGQSCPGGRHLVLLGMHSDEVMGLLLALCGRPAANLDLDLAKTEEGLVHCLDLVRRLRIGDPVRRE